MQTKGSNLPQFQNGGIYLGSNLQFFNSSTVNKEFRLGSMIVLLSRQGWEKWQNAMRWDSNGTPKIKGSFQNWRDPISFCKQKNVEIFHNFSGKFLYSSPNLVKKFRTYLYLHKRKNVSGNCARPIVFLNHFKRFFAGTMHRID